MTEFFVQEIFPIWRSGGWVLLALFLLAIFVYGFGMELLLYLKRKEFRRIPESHWSRWIARPEDAEGEVGEIVRYAGNVRESLAELNKRFQEIRLAEFPRIDRRLVFLTVLVTAAPLLGLLGTVFGMLTTFSGLAAGTGRVIESVAGGISEALITTQMGLLIAIPGYFLVHAIRRRRNEYEAFLIRLECLIATRRKQQNGGER